MEDIGLISRKQKERGLPHLELMRDDSHKIPAMLKISAVLFIIVLFAMGGIFIWERALAGEVQSLENEKVAVIGLRDAAVEEKVRSVEHLLASFEELSESHVRWTKLLALIQERAVRGVVFSSFAGEADAATLMLSGSAPNYLTLSQQIRALEGHGSIVRADVEKVSLDRSGRVEFNIHMEFKRTLLAPEDLPGS